MSWRKAFYDPRLYGRAARWLRATDRASLPVSASLALASAVVLLMLRDPLWAVVLAASAAFSAAAPYIAARTYSYVVASGTEGELPAALAFLIPYAASSRDLANLLVYAARELKLRFLGREAWRLEALMASGNDERAALRFLADTSPSQRLRLIITELLNAEELGLPRSRLVATLYSRTLDLVRTSWSNYVKVGEVVVEGVITLVASAAILVPIAVIGSASLLAPLAAISAAISIGSALLLAFERPRLGDLEGGWSIGGLTLTAAVLASAFTAWGRIAIAVAVLAIAAVYSESLNVVAERKASLAAAKLREAAARARLGMTFDEQLRLAAPAGGKVVEAVAKAFRVAGRVGLGGAIESFADVINDAMRAVSSVRVEGILLESLSAVVPAVSAVAIRVMASYVASSTVFAFLGLGSLAGSLNVLLFMAPLAPLPAAALQRGRRMSATPSLASLVTTLLAMKLF